jgi:hypothetical protein
MIDDVPETHMKQMSRNVEPAIGGSNFNNFLFSPIGTDCFGAQVSVASALSRLDIDAWAEAAVLAQMPHDAAARRLAKSISRFAEIPQIERDSEKVALNLVRLLPDRKLTDLRHKLTRWPFELWQSWIP